MPPGEDRIAKGAVMTDASRQICDEGRCQAVAPELVAAYSRGALAQAAAWSVEAHLPACRYCRAALAVEVDRARLERNRAVLLTRLALSQAGGPVTGTAAVLLTGLAGRLAAWCGVPPHIWRLLSVTPSLRRSWLAGVALVLGTAIGTARFVVVHAEAAGATARPAGLLLFLLLAPLLPLAGVAAAFYPRLDPAADLATAAPLSGIWLFCVRAVAVIAAVLVPVMLAALAVPGGGWLPLLVVLPALAVSTAAVALATVVRPLAAAIGVGVGWVGVVAGASLTAGSAVIAYGGMAQAASLGVLIAAGCLFAARRRALDFGWNR